MLAKRERHNDKIYFQTLIGHSRDSIKILRCYIKENYDISIQGFENLSLDKNKIIFSGLDDMLRSYPDVKNSLAGVIFDEGIKHDGQIGRAHV